MDNFLGGPYCSGGILLKEAFALGGFLTVYLRLGCFCPVGFCGGLFTGNPSKAIRDIDSVNDLKYQFGFILLKSFT